MNANAMCTHVRSKLEEQESRVLVLLADTLLQYHWHRVVAALAQQKEKDEENKSRGTLLAFSYLFRFFPHSLMHSHYSLFRQGQLAEKCFRFVGLSAHMRVGNYP